MKKIWLSKRECTGCGACENICPKRAITMKEDDSGFSYPEINSNCIDCNVCEKVCRGRGHEAKEHQKTPIVYAAWSNCDAIRYNSTSGGLFSEIAKVILADGGYAVGAAYGANMLVSHVMIDDESDLDRIRQSKYVQSDTGSIYKAVLEKLNDNKKVLFCGAPCQVAALYAFLKKDDDNLITIDFICRGVNSPKAYAAWLREIEEEEKSKAVKVWFKYKEGGWKTSPQRTRIDFEDGHYLVTDGEKNLFMQGYLSSNLYMRPSCGSCEFKGVPRQGDITLADFWKIDETLDDDKGTSMVLINSRKGQYLFEKAKRNLSCHERKFEEILEGNRYFGESVKVTAVGENFLRDLDNGKFSDVIAQYMCPESAMTRIVNKIKKGICFLRKLK